jgi:hypothetical protein
LLHGGEEEGGIEAMLKSIDKVDVDMENPPHELKLLSEK